MNFLAEYKFEPAYRPEPYDFTADFLTRYSNQEDFPDKAQNVGVYVSTAEERPVDLDVRREMSRLLVK